MENIKPLRQAHANALKYVSYKSRSEAEVRSRLLRHYSNDLVEEVLIILKESSVVDDKRFANEWRDSRDAHNPRAAWIVEKELIAKGICKTLAKETIHKMDDNESAYKAAFKEASKFSNANHVTFQRKLYAYLRRRGYSDFVLQNTISHLWRSLGNRV